MCNRERNRDIRCIDLEQLGPKKSRKSSTVDRKMIATYTTKVIFGIASIEKRNTATFKNLLLE